jgi:hypothetical protein
MDPPIILGSEIKGSDATKMLNYYSHALLSYLKQLSDIITGL